MAAIHSARQSAVPIAHFLVLCLLICNSSYAPAAQQSKDARWVVQDNRATIELYAEFDPALNSVWANLQEVQNEMAELLNLRPSSQPIQIMLFNSHDRYLKYLEGQIPEARQRRALFFRNGNVSQIYAFRSRSLITDLRHELTHVILHQNLQFLPLWMDEGLAEYFEERASVRSRSSRMTAVRWKARVGWNPALNQLESIPSAARMTADDYRDSWAWVFFLLHGSPASRDLLVKYLQTIQRGEAPGAFSLYLAARTGDSKNSLNSYFRKTGIPVTFTGD